MSRWRKIQDTNISNSCIISSGAGNDSISGTSTGVGGSGNISIGLFNDINATIDMGTGKDSITGTATNGNGSAIGIENNGSIRSGAGNDSISGTGTSSTGNVSSNGIGEFSIGYGILNLASISGGEGDDSITGIGTTNSSNDSGIGIFNLRGSSSIHGGKGNDSITGTGTGSGIENTGTIDTGNGNDTITGTGGFFGIRSSGTINTGTGNDIITGATTPGQASSNLVVNGDFESGNTGFSSEYPYQTFTAQSYDISTDPNLWNGAWTSFGDHTSGTGEMMVVDGNTGSSGVIVWEETISVMPNVNYDEMMVVDGNTWSSGIIVWEETISVMPNVNYDFSSWIASTYPVSPAELNFQVNGVQVGSTFTASTTPGEWEQFNTTWNSGSNTSVTLSIIDQNFNLVGNDFALDDISLTPSVAGIFNDVTIDTGEGNDIVDALIGGFGGTGTTQLGNDEDILKGFGSGFFDGGNGKDTLLFGTGTYSVSDSANLDGFYTVSLGTTDMLVTNFELIGSASNPADTFSFSSVIGESFTL